MVGYPACKCFLSLFSDETCDHNIGLSFLQDLHIVLKITLKEYWIYARKMQEKAKTDMNKSELNMRFTRSSKSVPLKKLRLFSQCEHWLCLRSLSRPKSKHSHEIHKMSQVISPRGGGGGGGSKTWPTADCWPVLYQWQLLFIVFIHQLEKQPLLKNIWCLMDIFTLTG